MLFFSNVHTLIVFAASIGHFLAWLWIANESTLCEHVCLSVSILFIAVNQNLGPISNKVVEKHWPSQQLNSYTFHKKY